MRVPSGKITTASPRLEQLARGRDRLLVRLAAADREGAEAVEEPALPAVVEQLLLGDEVDRPAAGRQPMTNGSRKLRWLEARMTAPSRDVLAPQPPQPEVDEQDRLDDRTGRSSRRAAAHRAAACARGSASSMLTVPTRDRPSRVTLPWMDLRRSVNGALAGGVAASRLGCPATGRQAGLRIRLRRRRAARQARDPRLGLAGGRPGPARCERGRCSAPSTPSCARSFPGRRSCSAMIAGTGRELRPLAARAAGRPLPPRPRRAPAAVAATAARWRRPPGGTSLFAVVLGELERRLNARARPRSRGRGAGLLERPRQHRAGRRRGVDSAALPE